MKRLAVTFVDSRPIYCEFIRYWTVFKGILKRYHHHQCCGYLKKTLLYFRRINHLDYKKKKYISIRSTKWSVANHLPLIKFHCTASVKVLIDFLLFPVFPSISLFLRMTIQKKRRISQKKKKWNQFPVQNDLNRRIKSKKKQQSS